MIAEQKDHIQKMKKINIEGMSCMHCVARVEKALKGVEGISSVEVKLDENCAIVAADAGVTDAQLVEVIDDAGYDVTGVIEI